MAFVPDRDEVDEGALIASAKARMKVSDPTSALELAESVLQTSPDSIDALLIAGEAAAQIQDLPQALEYYRRIPRDNSPQGLQATFGQAEVLFHQGQLAESANLLEWLIETSPDYLLAHYRLSILWGLSGRRWEAIPHQMKLLRNGRGTVADLNLLSDTARAIDQRDYLKTCLKTDPDSVLARLGLAVIALSENRIAQSEELLNRVIRLDPNLVEAHARLGEILVTRQAPAEFQAWNRQLPAEAQFHPDIWKAWGNWAHANGDLEGAARCYYEGIRLAPNHRFLCYQLGLTLQALNRLSDAEVYLERYRLLQQLAIVADGLHHHPQDLGGIQKAALLTERLGRLWEAWAWARAALSQQDNLAWAITALQRLSPKLNPQTPDTLASFHPTIVADISDLPLPSWISTKPSSQKFDSATADRSRRASFSNDPFVEPRFVDLAESAGVDFRYHNGADPNTKGARIIETTGGGIAVWDYDNDLQPDLYFSQGGEWPPTASRHSRSDRLFRNRGQGTFRDDSAVAGLTSSRFAQGVNAGDVNGDGFADLYVGCIGPNRLYLNNGDGTFTETAHQQMRAQSVWTTSCLIADLNGDGFPDLYDVNYCRANENEDLSTICGTASSPRTCSPLAFRAEFDRLLVNRGDGSFRDTSEESLVALPNGYGLGVIACQIVEDRGLDLFVANDQVSNFLFVNQTGRPGDSPRFSEEGLLRGLAVDGLGRRQGSMGIAAGDVNHDARIDFFVTNFYHESNTLYTGNSLEMFADSTPQSNLRDSGFSMLGFGTQFLDYDLDGDQDLIVANGHVDDLTALGQPYRMAPQFFRKERNSLAFVPVEEWDDESYFAGQYLGRGLARWDWNGDGREEFVVSHMNSNCAVVANLTQTHSHYLAIRLVGTESSRDAVGAIVRVSTQRGERTRHLTAGDGFQSANERRLVFGLGSGEGVGLKQLTVRWPSGKEEEYSTHAIDEELLMIEGRGVYSLPRRTFSFH